MDVRICITSLAVFTHDEWKKCLPSHCHPKILMASMHSFPVPALCNNDFHNIKAQNTIQMSLLN